MENKALAHHDWEIIRDSASYVLAQVMFNLANASARSPTSGRIDAAVGNVGAARHWCVEVSPSASASCYQLGRSAYRAIVLPRGAGTQCACAARRADFGRADMEMPPD
ncbi:MAG TPA: hypothetical protein PK264_20545 [Hyphomicrobiaceae bacterium]|nr:hypothetical protein [Hyphomicrobiaceae bacterium]